MCHSEDGLPSGEIAFVYWAKPLDFKPQSADKPPSKRLFAWVYFHIAPNGARCLKARFNR